MGDGIRTQILTIAGFLIACNIIFPIFTIIKHPFSTYFAVILWYILPSEADFSEAQTTCWTRTINENILHQAAHSNHSPYTSKQAGTVPRGFLFFLLKDLSNFALPLTLSRNYGLPFVDHKRSIHKIQSTIYDRKPLPHFHIWYTFFFSEDFKDSIYNSF